MPTASTLLKIDTPARPCGRSALPADGRVHQLSIDGYRRAVTLEQELSAGKNIGASAANWLRGYQTTSEYFAHRDMHRDVGDHFVWFE